ncbi:MAG: hypothetical protein L0216_20180 [Planctomycetales bacterium]|nr:hypothetical protein [Planctomycetales bacterium]
MSPPLILGHRGASRDAPENTLSAFRLALSQGAHGVELDVRRSGDGELLCLHDADLGRTVPGEGEVEYTPAATIRAADAGGWFSPTFRGERVPTLVEACDALRTARLVMVEVKAPKDDRDLLLPGISEAMAAFLRAPRPGPALLVASFTVPILREIHEAVPEAPLAAIVGRAMGPSEWRWLLGLPLRAVSLGDEWATPDRIRQIRETGRDVYVWTVDDVGKAGDLLELGVSGIVTNTPTRLVRGLAGRDGTD